MVTLVKSIMLLFSISTLGQQSDSIRINGHLKNNTKFVKVVVKQFGIGNFDIACVPIKNGKFAIAAPNTINKGVYRLHYSQSSLHDYIDIIIDGKEKHISFELDVNKPDKTINFIQSIENKKWHDYQGQSSKLLQKIELLSQFINQYPKSKDLIFLQSKKAFVKEKAIYQTSFNNFIKQNKNMWATEMIANKPVYFSDPSEDLKIQDYYRRNNYWKKINTINPKLINTPLYNELILNYLRYYMNPEMNFGEEELDTGLKKSVDTIMQKFNGNPQTKVFALKYLQLGFKEIGQEKILQYIDTKYKTIIEQCNNDEEKANFDKRVKGYEALKQGNQAPNIYFDDKTGKIISLTDLANKKIIIAFWASWCPSCEEQLPQLQNFIKNNPAYVAVAVSLDNDQKLFDEAIKKYPNFYHTCDFKKWQGKTVNDYYIYGSPSFILLDKDKKIINKFSSWQAILNELD